MRIEAYLKRRGVRKASKLAQKALQAAQGQRATTPAEQVASEIVRELAERALDLKERTAGLDGELEKRVLTHPLAQRFLQARFPTEYQPALVRLEHRCSKLT